MVPEHCRRAGPGRGGEVVTPLAWIVIVYLALVGLSLWWQARHAVEVDQNEEEEKG